MLDEALMAFVKAFMEEQIPFNKHLGIRLLELREGEATLEIPYRDALIGDPFRPALHGGVISALLDTCGGAAVFSTFTDVGDRTSTVDLRVDYLRPGRQETVRAHGRVLRIGNRVAVVHLDAFHPGAEDAPIATGTGVYNVRRAQDG